MVVTQSVNGKSTARIKSHSVLTQRISLRNVPVPTNKPGSTSRDEVRADKTVVRGIQQELAALNLYHGEIDGLYGQATRAAILHYQAQVSIKQTGHPDDELLALMQRGARSAGTPMIETVAATSTTPAQPPRDAKLVAQIQMGLANYGVDGIVVDGIYGTQTATAIRRFQQRFDLQVDGEPNRSVLKKLREVGALRNS